MTGQPRHDETVQHAQVLGSKWHLWHWIVVVSITLYFVIFFIPAVGLLIWIYFDELRNLIEWLFWGSFLIVLGVLLIAVSGLSWFRKRHAIAEKRSLTQPEFILGIVGMVFLAWGVLIAAIDPATNEQKTDLAQIAVAITGGAIVAVGSWVGWQTLRLSRDRFDLDRVERVRDSFAMAVTQLGATRDTGEPLLETRIGGIYTLEHIAKTWIQRGDTAEYWAIMEVLAAYLRYNTIVNTIARSTNTRAEIPTVPDILDTQTAISESDSLKGFLANRAPDVEAIIEVMRRRDDRGAEDQHLWGLDLRRVQLPRADLSNMRLQRAFLLRANLEGAILTNANLESANVRGSNLSNANLHGAQLHGAIVSRVYLDGHANSYSSRFQAVGAGPGDPRISIQQGSTADLTNTNLQGVDLRCVYGLTIEALLGARNINPNLVPDYLREEYLKRTGESTELSPDDRSGETQ